MATKASQDQVSKPLLFTTSDMKGNLVICAISTWNHIEKRHPEMRGREMDVQETVSAPDTIFTSTSSPHALIHEKLTSDQVQMRAVATYDEISAFQSGTTIAKVNTAYAVDTILYERPNVGLAVYRKTVTNTGH